MPDTLRDRRIRHARALLSASPGGLIAEAGDLAGRDVLVLGHSVGETLCELIATECRSAEARVPGCRVDRHAVDVVLVPNLAEGASGAIIKQAIAALARGGRIVVRLPPTASRLAHELRETLVLSGFDQILEVRGGAARVVSASRLAAA